MDTPALTREEKRLYRRAARKALRMQGLVRLLFRLGLGGLRMSRTARVEHIPTRRGPVRVLEYGFEDAAVRPVYFDMHGGGFIMMQADADEVMNEEFCRLAGVKVVSIDYPKAPQAPYPAAVEAVWDVVAYFLDHAGEYRIRPTGVGIGGHSAGANLATVTCLRNARQHAFDLAYQVLDYPPLDLATDPYQKPCPKGAISPKDATLYNLCYIAPERAREVWASPVYAAPGDLAGLPPALLLVCGRDSLEQEGLAYGRQMRDAGVAVEVEHFADCPHGFTYGSMAAPDVRRAVERMAGFIREHAAP